MICFVYWCWGDFINGIWVVLRSILVANTSKTMVYQVQRSILPSGALSQHGPALRMTDGRTLQREVGGHESLSVTHEPDQQRQTFRAAVCEERARAAAGARAARQARGVIISTINHEKSSEVM